MPGAGAFEVAAYCMLMKEMESLKGRAKLGALVSENLESPDCLLPMSIHVVIGLRERIAGHPEDTSDQFWI